MPLSPYVEEPLISKVIESLVPEQRSRYMFFKFRDSYVVWTFDVRFTHSHIMAMVHLYIFGARDRHIRIMGMVRLGYQRDDQAKNIGSISSGLFR